MSATSIPSAPGLAALVDFGLAHPVDRFDARTLTLILEDLTRGPEGVFDLIDEGSGARLVCALIENAINEVDSAELCPIGASGPLDAQVALLLRALDRALELARSGSRAHLELPVRDPHVGVVPALLERGFGLAFTSYDMLTRDASYCEVAPPPGLRFVDLQPVHAAQAHAFILRAFAGLPGLMALPEDGYVERILSHTPPIRVLVDDEERLAGFIRVGPPSSDKDETGYIHLIARDAARRGQGLGPVLLGEAMRLLVALGARRFGLDVVAVNQTALDLYQRHGFEVTTRCATYRRSIR